MANGHTLNLPEDILQRFQLMLQFQTVPMEQVLVCLEMATIALGVLLISISITSLAFQMRPIFNLGSRFGLTTITPKGLVGMLMIYKSQM